MFDRFTDRAKKVLSFARREAMRLNHEFIGPEHILLGIVEEGSGVAASVLKKENIDLEKVRHEVERIVKAGPSRVTMAQLPFTPRGKKVLELSMEEASNLRHDYIGTEHLLLGLIRENDGIAGQVMRSLGVELEEVREDVLALLGASDNCSRTLAPGVVVPSRRSSDAVLRLTDRAKQVMSFARQEAIGLHHEYIGTEHILLGLVQQGSGVAANVLKNMNVDLEMIRHEVEKIVKTGPSMVTMGQLPFSPRAKKVLELSMEEASQLGHNYLGTEHLLLGLIRENEGIAAQVMRNLGVKLEEVREEVLEFLGCPDDSSRTSDLDEGVHYSERRTGDAVPPAGKQRGRALVMLPKRPEFDALYRDGIMPALSEAGLDDICKGDDIFKPGARPSKVAQLVLTAEVLVAVVTQQDPDVTYQLWLCHGMRRHPILIAHREEEIPFQLRSVRLVRFEDGEAGTEKLRRELATLVKKHLEITRSGAEPD